MENNNVSELKIFKIISCRQLIPGRLTMVQTIVTTVIPVVAAA